MPFEAAPTPYFIISHNREIVKQKRWIFYDPDCFYNYYYYQ
jgi:hypothetical protein